ncbi:MAG: hypothetical protein ABI895_34645 [Deltaproteobacteria bacterium]
MNNALCHRVSASAGLLLAVAFSSPSLLAAEPASDVAANEASTTSAVRLDHPSAVLDTFADHAHDARLTSAWLSIGSGALLVGSGLLTAYSGDRDSYGHFVWGAGTLSVASGVLQLFLPSSLEKLDRDWGGRTPGYSPAGLDSAWQQQAEAARVERYVAGSIDLTVAAGGITAGALLSSGVGNLSGSSRTRWAVTSFVTGGLMTLAGVLTLVRKSDVEKGYELAFPTSSTPKIVDVGVAAGPGGGTLQLFGTF